MGALGHSACIALCTCMRGAWLPSTLVALQSCTTRQFATPDCPVGREGAPLRKWSCLSLPPTTKSQTRRPRRDKTMKSHRARASPLRAHTGTPTPRIWACRAMSGIAERGPRSVRYLSLWMLMEGRDHVGDHRSLAGWSSALTRRGDTDSANKTETHLPPSH